MKELLTELIEHAYAPYSNYKVAAMVVMDDGEVFGGVNVENASYGATICAERNAITSAITKGYKKENFKSLYVMTLGQNPAFPCFICRQVICEFFDLNCQLVIMNQTSEEHYLIKDIITKPFGKEDLF